MNFERLNGLIAAPNTPFKADGSLNLGLVEKQAASLVANGVAGAFVCGTTGEGLSLTSAERMQVTEQWVKMAPRQLRVVVHVGANALAEAVELARHAQRVGASGIGAFAPSFFKPSSIKDLVRFCGDIAAAAPDLPFYYYNIPSMTGVSLACADFLAAGAETIPNLAGVKFTYENLMDYLACVQLDGGRFDAVFGRDEMLAAALALGATGAIGSTYNYMAPVYHKIMEAFKRGDLVAARAAQGRANAAIAAMIRHGGMSAGKAIMSLIGIDCGPMRPPMRSLSKEQISALRKDLEQCGFFEFCSRA